ncbi:hypothetical protein GQ457_01G020350 [Hibiscus cannabinus]
MLLLDSGEIESESEEDEPIVPRETVQEEDDTLQSFETGDVLVIKRSLTTQPTQDNQQRENIFHTRCLVNNKVCVVIIDGGSCTNVASSIMVEKLGLKTMKHPNPYQLQWLNDGGEIEVTKQVLVPFTIGKYKDEVLCDVVAMGACHLLLGRSWQFDKGQKITLAPLTPSQVQEDQVRLRNNMEEAKKKKRLNVKRKIRMQRFDNVQRAFSVFMLCIIRKGTRTKASLAPSDSEFLVEVVESSGWYWCRLGRKRKFPTKPKSKLFPFVVVVDLGTNRFQEGGMISFQLNEADTPSASSFQLIETPFSSTSALLAQLKLNNPEVAETHPVQERVSYEHVDSKRGVLHLSMHMHNMCDSLGMLWACGRDLGTSQACGWLNQPISLHLFPPKWCENTLQMCGSHSIRPKEEYAYYNSDIETI